MSKNRVGQQSAFKHMKKRVAQQMNENAFLTSVVRGLLQDAQQMQLSLQYIVQNTPGLSWDHYQEWLPKYIEQQQAKEKQEVADADNNTETQ